MVVMFQPVPPCCPRVRNGVCEALRTQAQRPNHFLPAALSAFCPAVVILPNMTTPLPSKNAMRDRPSQFLNVSTTSGCCGTKLHSAISLLFSACGSSIFLPPVSLPIFHAIFDTRHAERPHRTK